MEQRQAVLDAIQTHLGCTRTQICVALGYAASTTPLLNWLRTGSPAFENRLVGWLQNLHFPLHTSIQEALPRVYLKSSPTDQVLDSSTPPPERIVLVSKTALKSFKTLRYPVQSAVAVLCNGNLFLKRGGCLALDLSFSYPIWPIFTDITPVKLSRWQGSWTLKMSLKGRRGLSVNLLSPQDLQPLKEAVCSMVPRARLDDPNSPIVFVMTLPTFRRSTPQELLLLQDLCTHSKNHLVILLLSSGSGELVNHIRYPELSDSLVELPFSGPLRGSHLVQFIGLLASPKPVRLLHQKSSLLLPTDVEFDPPLLPPSGEWSRILATVMLREPAPTLLVTWPSEKLFEVRDPPFWPPPGMLLQKLAKDLPPQLKLGSAGTRTYVWGAPSRGILFWLHLADWVDSDSLSDFRFVPLQSLTEEDFLYRELAGLCKLALGRSSSVPAGWEQLVVPPAQDEHMPALCRDFADLRVTQNQLDQ